MEVSVPTLVLLLWLKTLLNWAVVLIQWPHVTRTFSGFFCFSLALLDTLLDIMVFQVFLAEDLSILDVRLTRYHICLLVQIAGLVYGVLHWPAFLLIGLDTHWTTSADLGWLRRLLYICGTVLLWVLGTFYVISRPDFSPVTGDELYLQECKITSSSQGGQVAAVSLLLVLSVLLYTSAPEKKWMNEQKRADLRHSIYTFLSTWSSFLVLLVLLLGFQVEIPAYLDMNVLWLALLHSFHVVLAFSRCSCLLCSEKEEVLQDKLRGESALCLWTQCFT